MSTTLTVRTGEDLMEALRGRAAAQGKTVSELVREILEEAFEERPVAARAGHLRGRLELGTDHGDPWRQQLRARSWRS